MGKFAENFNLGKRVLPPGLRGIEQYLKKKWLNSIHSISYD